jgi:hypothetical protein
MSVNEESATQEQPTRCWLVSFSTLAGASYSEAIAGHFKPSLAIDVGKDRISVLDPNTDALVASAPLAEVTATPANREYKYGSRRTTMPMLVVCVPGSQRLTVGCLEVVQGFVPTLRSVSSKNAAYRFSWRGTVPPEKDPAYFVSGADWLTLVEKFGLAPQLEDSEPTPTQAGSSSSTSTPASGSRSHEELPTLPPPLYSQPRYARVTRSITKVYLIVCVAFVVILIILSFFIRSEPPPSAERPPSTQTTIPHSAPPH